MDEETLAEVKQFLEALEQDWPLERAILFGSRARGDQLRYSDVDLLPVSDAFEGIAFPDRPSKLYQHWRGGLPLEILCYTPTEFYKKRQMIGLVQDAVKEGISLLPLEEKRD
jgi:predicted nucleotidyltransferase